jgi:hypothetical protein
MPVAQRAVHFLIVFATMGIARSATNTEPQLGPLDPEIRLVESGASWERGEAFGYYRALVQTRCSPEHCRDRLFIQWVSRPVWPKPRPSRVVDSRYVREVGDLTNVTRVRFILSTGGTKLEVEHHVGDDDELKWTRCLSLRAEGTYGQVEAPCG